MKTIKSLAVILSLCSATSALADVSLQVPKNIDLLVANEAKPELSGSLFSANKTLTLPNGENQLVFRYVAFFDQGSERVILESDPIIATFAAEDSKLSFELPTYRDGHQARKEIENVSWQLLDDSGNTVSVRQDLLLKDGMQIGRDYRREVTDYNRIGGQAAWVGGAAAMTATAMSAKANNNQASQPVSSSTAEEMLHFWYNKADAETKARFKAYVNAQ
ncbi:DUF2057 family protein [Vibrio sp.]|uniref:DUF2057 family protein n=1 Tax=Vibrio sp. TaxID=678 RepID=UPI003D0D7CB2